VSRSWFPGPGGQTLAHHAGVGEGSQRQVEGGEEAEDCPDKGQVPPPCGSKDDGAYSRWDGIAVVDLDIAVTPNPRPLTLNGERKRLPRHNALPPNLLLDKRNVDRTRLSSKYVYKATWQVPSG
jgi:hypothetical protein